MPGWVGGGLRKGKARPATAPVADAQPAWPAGRWVALAGPPEATLGLALRRAVAAAGARAVVVVDAWGRPPPPRWRRSTLAVGWARAAGPAAAVAMLEVLLARPDIGCVILRSLDDCAGLPRWPRRATAGVPRALYEARRRGVCVVALLGCPRPHAYAAAAAPPAQAGAGPSERLAGPARLFALDAVHATTTRLGARGRELLEWASLRAQTCQPTTPALASGCRQTEQFVHQVTKEPAK